MSDCFMSKCGEVAAESYESLLWIPIGIIGVLYFLVIAAVLIMFLKMFVEMW